jgi:hypothetical protein
MMIRLTVLVGLVSFSMFGQVAPKKVFIDPASKWTSLHDDKGSGTPAELAATLTKSCPSVIVTLDPESATYAISVFRDTGAGSVVIYSGKEMVNSFKPGFFSTLQKVSATICSFIGSRP